MMAMTKSERRYNNRLKMRLSHIDLNDETPATPQQVRDFVESMERSNKYEKTPKHHPHKKVKR